jgi:RNA polymerase-binding protein DksA
MKKTFENRQKEVLRQSKQDILRSLASESEEFQIMIRDMDPKDTVDFAADDISRTTLETLNSRDRRLFSLIESALGRIENGVYGNCLRCGGPIPEERLKAIPYVLMCINCQNSEERRTR